MQDVYSFFTWLCWWEGSLIIKLRVEETCDGRREEDAADEQERYEAE